MTALLSTPPPLHPTVPIGISPEPTSAPAPPDDGRLYEWVDEEWVEKKLSDISQLVANNLNDELVVWRSRTNAGRSFVESSFQCFSDAPEKFRRPDVAFVSAARLAGYQWGQGHFRVVPDLVVEVVSPNDEVYELDRKIRDYFQAGVRSVWVINPELRILRQHHKPGDVSEWVDEVDVTDESVLPGFRCPLQSLFVQPGAGAAAQTSSR